MIHRHTEIWKWQESAPVSPDPRDMLLSFQTGSSFVRAAVAWSILERTSGFEASSENNYSNVFEAFYSTHHLFFYLNLPLNAIRAGCYQFGFLGTDLHLISCAGFIKTQLGLLVPAIPQLEHLCHQQTANW